MQPTTSASPSAKVAFSNQQLRGKMHPRIKQVKSEPLSCYSCRAASQEMDEATKDYVSHVNYLSLLHVPNKKATTKSFLFGHLR